MRGTCGDHTKNIQVVLEQINRCSKQINKLFKKTGTKKQIRPLRIRLLRLATLGGEGSCFFVSLSIPHKVGAA